MNGKIKTYTLVAAIATAVLSGAAGAQSGPDGQNPAERFAQMDADGNGAVTLEEMQAHRAARFSGADADGDGALSATELAALMQDGLDRRAERMIERMDADNDGKLSEAELARRGEARMFDRLDADDDGALSDEEFAQARHGHGDRRHGHDGKDHREGGRHHRH